MKVQLDDTGLKILVAELMKVKPQDVQLPLEAITARLGFLAFKADGLRLDFHRDDLEIHSVTDHLDLRGDARNVLVHVAELSISQDVIGRGTITTCTDMDIVIAEASPLTLHGLIRPELANGEFTIVDRELNLAVLEEEYRVIGPLSCEGIILSDETYQRIIGAFFEMIKPLVYEKIRQQIDREIDSFADELNDLTSQGFEFPLPKPLPEQTIRADLVPFEVIMRENLLIYVSGVKLAKVAKGKNQAIDTRKTTLPSMPLVLGLNPELFSYLFDTMFADERTILIEESLLGGLTEVLKLSRLASIWPELTGVETTSPFARGQLHLDRTPRLVTDPVQDALKIQWQAFSVTLQIEIEQHWVDFFVLDMGFDGGIRATMEGPFIGLELIDDFDFDLDGDFSQSYEPRIPIFERDVAMALAYSAMDYLVAGGPHGRTLVPVIPLGGQWLTLGQPYFSDSFIEIPIQLAKVSP
jgi:hypothetical protein